LSLFRSHSSESKSSTLSVRAKTFSRSSLPGEGGLGGAVILSHRFLKSHVLLAKAAGVASSSSSAASASLSLGAWPPRGGAASCLGSGHTSACKHHSGTRGKGHARAVGCSALGFLALGCFLFFFFFVVVVVVAALMCAVPAHLPTLPLLRPSSYVLLGQLPEVVSK
jgi:hypothetical protein